MPETDGVRSYLRRSQIKGSLPLSDVCGRGHDFGLLARELAGWPEVSAGLFA
jgi:hypothetical protein